MFDNNTNILLTFIIFCLPIYYNSSCSNNFYLNHAVKIHYYLSFSRNAYLKSIYLIFIRSFPKTKGCKLDKRNALKRRMKLRKIGLYRYNMRKW